MLGVCIQRLDAQLTFARDRGSSQWFHLSLVAEMFTGLWDDDGRGLSDVMRMWKSWATQSRATQRMAGFWTFFIREILYKHSLRNGLKPWVLDKHSSQIQQATFDPHESSEPMEIDCIRPISTSVQTPLGEVEWDFVRRGVDQATCDQFDHMRDEFAEETAARFLHS